MRIQNILYSITILITIFYINIWFEIIMFIIISFVSFQIWLYDLKNKYYTLKKYLKFETEYEIYLYINFNNFPNIFTISFQNYRELYFFKNYKFKTIKSILKYIENIKSEEHLKYLFYKD